MSGPKWCRQRAIAAIRARHKQGLPLVCVWRDEPALYRAAQTHCGSWRQAVLDAGLTTRSYRRWSRERVIKELQAWYRVSSQEAALQDNGLASAAARYFGTWRQALQAAGLAPKRFRKWTKQRVIVAIQDRHIRGLPIHRIERKHRSLVTAARHYFGGWKNALEAAGLGDHHESTRPPRDWSSQTVVAEIQAFYRQGGAVTTVWKKDPTLYSAAKKQFGSWRSALQAAGFRPSRRVWSKQEIVDEIRDRCRQRQSLSSGIPANKNLAAAAIRYFGTWQGALQAAGINRTKSKRERLRCYAKKSSARSSTET